MISKKSLEMKIDIILINLIDDDFLYKTFFHCYSKKWNLKKIIFRFQIYEIILIIEILKFIFTLLSFRFIFNKLNYRLLNLFSEYFRIKWMCFISIPCLIGLIIKWNLIYLNNSDLSTAFLLYSNFKTIKQSKISHNWQNMNNL